MTPPASNTDVTTPAATDPFSPSRLSGHLDGLGLSRAKVAARIGRTEPELTAYEDGVTQPPRRVAAALAGVLGVTVGDLHQQRGDWADDYVDAVAGYCQPETEAELEAAASALRSLDAIVDRHRRATAGAVATPNPERHSPDPTATAGLRLTCAESDGPDQCDIAEA